MIAALPFKFQLPAIERLRYINLVMSTDVVNWLYLDMNSFFASVEQELNPTWRGRPVAVVPLLADSTSCIAVSYEGKAFGIKTGTKVGEAKRLCKQMIFVVGDHKNYIQYHQQIVEVVESCVPVDAVCSIDEMACKLTGSQSELARAMQLAQKIKTVIRQRVGSSLRCSIGLAVNRYLAKIAADMQKPDGLTVLRGEDLPGKLLTLKLRDLPGVGPKIEERLNRRGIFTLEKLLSLTMEELRFAWGSVVGEEMFYLLRGKNCESKKTEQKSISHSHVLPPAMRNKQDALMVLQKLTAKAALRLRRDRLWSSRLEFVAKFSGRDPWHVGVNVSDTQDTAVFLTTIKEHWTHLPEGSVFAVGVVLSGLVQEEQRLPSLFDDKRRESLTKTIDRVNERFGKTALQYGALAESKSIVPLRIAFTRIPEEDEV